MKLTPERWQQIANLYELAVDQSEATRDAFLSEACAGDEALKREVESLLSHDAAQVIVDRSVWATAAPLFHERCGLDPGAALGPYRIEGLLGAGGMGQVFRASDTRLNRPVAIKVLPTGVGLDQPMRARFSREAMAVAALTHPHICRLYDVGWHEDVDFLVMEYLEGDTLAVRLASGPLPVDQALALAMEIASALDHAHRRGIIHRDLKPANIMLTAGGAKLLDFGLAKFRPAVGAGAADANEAVAGTLSRTSAQNVFCQDENGDAPITLDGAIQGTVRYMAPEQLEGRDVDARSDLFSFGAVFYEMLTGTRAFEGDNTTSVRAAILEREPPRVSSLQPQVPLAVDDIVRRCLAKGPAERWQTAGAILAELTRLSASSERARGPGREPWRWAAILLLPLLAGVTAWLSLGGFQRWFTNPPPGEIRSLAVLPLESLSGDPEQDYFADGMTEQLIADLAKIGDLRVISRGSAMRYRGSRKSMQTIARELQVDAIIEGSVLGTSDKVRITAKLIGGISGDIIWAQSFERDLRDVLAMQSEVARAISSKVDITLTRQEHARLTSVRSVDPEAHRLFLLGRFHANKATEEGLKTGIQYLERAIAENPDHAPAHASLAQAYTDLTWFGYVHPRDAMPKAKAAARDALRLDESVAEGHSALGSVHLLYDWNGPAAERELQLAIQLNPSLAIARLFYAGYLLTAKREEESIQQIRQAVELDPLSIRTHSMATIFLIFARRYDEAIEQARKGRELDPQYGLLVALEGLAYAEQRRFEEAVGHLELATQLDRNPTIVAFGAHVHAVAGQHSKASELILEAEHVAEQRYFCPYEIATAYVSLGDADTASKWFRKGVEDRADCMAWLGVEPWIDPFRSDPRYPGLLRDIGLDPHAR